MHPLLTFFGVSAHFAYGSTWYSHNAGRRCEPCQRWYDDYDDPYVKNDVELTTAPPMGKSPQAIDVLNDFPLLREDVLSGFLEAGVSGFKYHKANFIRNAPDQDYYFLEVSGRVDVEILDEGEGSVCPICRSYLGKKGGKYRWNQQFLPILDSWDGSDIVAIGNRSLGRRFCTRKVIDLALERGWHELEFGGNIPNVRVNLEDGVRWYDSVAEQAMLKWPELFPKC